MKPIYTLKEFNSAKSYDKLPIECYICNSIFYKTKHYLHMALNPNQAKNAKYCSKKCKITDQTTQALVECINCNINFTKKQCDIKRSKNHFCSKSCATTYNNKNKTHGTRRSKLEVYLEEQLTLLYPDLHINYNQKDAIGSELDIFIPSLSLAFELNGIFHYEPIYGNEKLNQIQSNDISKFKACHDAKINLCMIDTSQQKYFKESTSKQFLDIIVYHINLLANLTK